MSSALNISGKILGKTKPLFSDWAIALPENSHPLTLKTLITQIVLAEVEAFQTRQESMKLARWVVMLPVLYW